MDSLQRKGNLETIHITAGEGTITGNAIILELTDAQKQMWLLEQLNPNSPTNHITDLVFRINTPVDLDVFKACVEEIVSRHESLRTNLVITEGGVKQAVNPRIEFPLKIYDLHEMDSKSREKEAFAIGAEEARRPFDLINGPLIRVVLIRITNDQYLFLMPMHHIISDGWSAGVIIRDFMKGYQARMNKEIPDLPEPGILYSEYINQYRLFQQEENFEKGIAYWKDQLGGHYQF